MLQTLLATSAVLAVGASASAVDYSTTDSLRVNTAQVDGAPSVNVQDQGFRGNDGDTFTADLFGGTPTAGAGFVYLGSENAPVFTVGASGQLMGRTVDDRSDILLDASEDRVNNGDGTFTSTTTIRVYTADGGDLLPGGVTLGGEAINSLGIDVGLFRAGGDRTMGDDPLDYDQVVKEVGAGAYDAFVDGQSVFMDGPVEPIVVTEGNAFGIPYGNGEIGLQASVGVADGNDIGGLGLDEMTFELTVIKNIPAPGAAALLGLGGLAAVRRRR